MAKKDRDFVPALGFSWLTPLYDPVMAVLGEDVFKERLVEVAGAGGDKRILDLGCGTAATTILLKKRHPTVEAVGVDIDPQILKQAQKKCDAQEVSVELVEAPATDLPFEDESFDEVISNLVFHHLTPPLKRAALVETLRVLRPGGRLWLGDFGKPHGPVMRMTFLTVQLFDGFEPTTPHLGGELETMMEEAGFVSIQEVERRRSLLGSQTLYRATKPEQK